jgi:hypothetical protein
VIRELRDRRFWIEVASHPAVRPALLGLEPDEVGDVVQLESVLPLAADHGGFLFARRDALGAAVELHSLFKPEGWGREAHAAAREAAVHVFARGALAITTFEFRALPRSRPPRSFGFVSLGQCQGPIGEAIYWQLTRDAWRASPAFHRMGHT